MQPSSNLPAEQRYQALLSAINEHQQLWILTDQDGCVMLNSDDEDCVPVWPDEQQAASWATGEWADCQPMVISLDVWLQRWVPGLEEDEIAIAAFPNHTEEGVVLSPEAFARDLE